MAQRDPEMLVRSVEKAAADAGRSSTLLVTVCLVFLATIVETSHQDIFLNTSKPLPQIGTRLPLIGIFTVVPLAITLLHLAAALQVRGLLLRLHELAELVRGRPDEDTILDQLPTSLVVQWAIAPTGSRRLSAALLSLLVTLTLVVLPLATLLLAQLRFLPYHDTSVTWLHRLLILVDVLAIATILDLAAHQLRGARGRVARLQPSWRWSIAAGSFVWGVVVVAFIVATVPEERLERLLVDASANTVSSWAPVWDREGVCDGWTANPARLLAVKTLTEADGDNVRHMLCVTYLVTEHPDTSPSFTRRNLYLREALIAATAPSETLRAQVGEAEAWRITAGAVQVSGRDLRFADLSGAHLQGVNLRGADLRGAKLVYSRLAYADFGDVPASQVGGCPTEAATRWSGLDFCRTRLDRADLSFAQLRGANLFKAELDGANLRQAKVLDTVLSRADLRGVDLTGLNLTGANLAGADFTDADLESADLRGANLANVTFVGTKLAHARLDGAVLRGARMVLRLDDDGKAADLAGLGLAGADLRGATLAFVPPGWLDSHAHRDETATTAFWDELAAHPTTVMASLEALPDDVPVRDLHLAIRDDLGVHVLTLGAIAPANGLPSPVPRPSDLQLAATLARLACTASRDGVATGIARRVAAAAERDDRHARGVDVEPMRLFEVLVARRLRETSCLGSDTLDDARLCDLQLVEQTWAARARAASDQRLAAMTREPSWRAPAAPCVVPR